MISERVTSLSVYTLSALRAEEKTACRSLAENTTPGESPCPPLAQALNHTSSALDKVIFMQPYGDLSSRLGSIASALTLGNEVGAKVVIVWQQEAEHGFASSAWGALFEQPKLPLGCFPGESLRPETASCTVHTVNSRIEWLGVQNRWETVVLGAQSLNALCLKSAAQLTENADKELSWFYRLLKPDQRIQERVESFMQAHNWEDPSITWAGIYATASKHTKSSLKTIHGHPTGGGPLQLPIVNLAQFMPQISLISPNNQNLKLFIASEDPAVEEELKKKLELELIRGLQKSSGAAESQPRSPKNADGQHNTELDSIRSALGSIRPIVVSLPKTAAGGPLPAGNSIAGISEQQQVANLFLLSKCKVLIGSDTDTGYLSIAKRIGDAISLGAIS